MVAVAVLLGVGSVVRPSESRNGLVGRMTAGVAMVILVVTVAIDVAFVMGVLTASVPTIIVMWC